VHIGQVFRDKLKHLSLLDLLAVRFGKLEVILRRYREGDYLFGKWNGIDKLS